MKKKEKQEFSPSKESPDLKKEDAVCDASDEAQEAESVPLTKEEELELKIAELEKENASLKNQYLMAYADCENTRKRLQREKEDAISFANKSIIKDLLPSIDSLDIAINNTTDEGIKKGLEMVRTSVLDALKKWGLEFIDSVGEEYDPNFHEACLFEVSSDAEVEKVVETLQRGYKLHGKTIRPAKVKIVKPE